MSNLQYGTLRYLMNHQVPVEDLRIYNLTTLGSLIVHGWVERKGGHVGVTEAGVEACMAYHRAQPNYRQHDAEISERVRGLLHISALRAMKAAS